MAGRAEGRPAQLTRAPSLSDARRAYICVPLALVLHSSFIPDSDGGSLLLRLLIPPSSSGRSPLLPFKATKSRAEQVAELQEELIKDETLSEKDRLGAQLQGPCSSLRLINVEARVSEVGLADEAKGWAERLMEAAYTNVKPYRKLKVLINPVGGPGKALPLFQSRIRPVLEAAGCIMNVTVTTHVNHGLEIAQTLSLEEGYDAIVCVSGDGMLHEVLNGLAQRADAREALQTPVAPIPTGSGNAVALNLLGVAEGFNLALACLNLIKGQVMPLDVCSITQPADALDAPTVRPPKRQAGARNGRASQGAASPVSLNSAPTAPYTIHYSFLSQAIGLMADVDLGTEDMRALGDTRFVLGYIGGVLSNKECEVDIYVKMGHRGTRNKQEMRERMKAAKGGDHIDRATEENVAALRNGPVTDALPGGPDLPTLDVRDPSWPSSLLKREEGDDSGGQALDPLQWYRVDSSISALYAGTIPYVARDLLQFPYSFPGDDCVDLALQLQGGGRGAKLRAITTAETGAVVYDPALVYLKVEAYRVVPRLEAGNKKLKKGGLISIDGEHRPYRSFQVEVNAGVQFRVLSLYGKWCVPDVSPPTSAASTTT